MQVGRSGKPGRARLFDVVEEFGVMATPGSLTSVRPLVLVGSAQSLENQLMYTVSGTGPGSPPAGFVYGGNALFGRTIQPGLNQTQFCYSPVGMPLGNYLAALPVSARYTRRYVWDCVFARTFPVVASHVAELGLLDDAAMMAAAQRGMVMRSVSTLNSGAWTPVVNRAGAEIVGTSSGVAPTGAFQHFRFEYLDSTVPALNVYIDGTLRAAIVGIANLPTPTVLNEPFSCLVATGGAASPAGQVDYFLGGSRFFIEGD